MELYEILFIGGFLSFLKINESCGFRLFLSITPACDCVVTRHAGSGIMPHDPGRQWAAGSGGCGPKGPSQPCAFLKGAMSLFPGQRSAPSLCPYGTVATRHYLWLGTPSGV